MTTAARSRRVFIKTYGCQMNVYDSARIGEALAVHGWTAAESPEQADLVLLNTCHIREKAAEKVYSELGRLRRLRERREREGGALWLGVVGCVAQAEGAAMAERAPFLDLIVGPQAYHRLPEMLARRDRAAGVQLDTAFPAESKFDALPERAAEAGAVSAFLTVQEGCDKFCTFCVVPYTRGAEASRPVAEILAEARQLVRAGARELTLLGQNVNAYRGPGPDGETWGVARLLHALAAIPGVVRLRYTTSHPRDVDDALIEAHRDLPALMPFLHLPVQSGSDAVLEAMNRRYSVDDYRRVVDRLRRARPDLVLSSDFIVGFPGESDADFAATLAFVREIGFAQSFSFKFSPRPGTPAALLRKQVPEPVKAERLRELQALLDAQTAALAQATVGVRTVVLIERPGRHPGQMVGRTPWLQVAHLDDCRARPGDLVEVTITAALPHSLAARATAQPWEIAS